MHCYQKLCDYFAIALKATMKAKRNVTEMGIACLLLISLNVNSRSVVEWIASVTETVNLGSILSRIKFKSIKIGIFSFPA